MLFRSYQWQLSTDNGTAWNNIINGGVYSNATTATLNLTGVTLVMNNYQYRCIVTSSTCPPAATSSSAILTVSNASIGGTITPLNSSVCSATNTGTLTLSGHTGNVVRWESSTVGCAGPWTTIANTTTTLTFNNLAQTTYYHAIVQVTGCVAVSSACATVTFIAASGITITSDVGTTICQGDPALLTAVVGPTVTTFTNAGVILVPGSGTVGNASPYPANIVVAALPTSGVSVSSVTLTNITHTWESDISVLLQSPTGQNLILMSAQPGNENGGFGILNKTFTFSDAAVASLAAGVPSGNYKPTNRGAGVNWPAPGPGVVNQGLNPLLSSFTGDPNGTWKLYVVDVAGGDVGNIAGGYNIAFSVPGGPISGGTFL